MPAGLSIIRFCIAVLCSVIWVGQANALPPKQHALAMHGEPKYPADFTHIDYANPDAPKGGILKRAELGSFDNLNNFLLQGKAPAGLELTFDPLMQRAWNEPFTLYGLVAKEVRVAPDRSWIIFYLNSKARFHDGHAITAGDVAFTFDALRQYGRPNQRAVFKLIKQIKIMDTRTVRIDFAPGFNRETVMIVAKTPVLPKHYWAKREFNKTTMTPPVASGPYKIKTVEPGRRVIYERVRDYWAKDLPINQGLYNFDQIIYDYYRDDRIALQAFGSGAYDLRIESSPLVWKRDYNFKGVTDGSMIKEEFNNQRPQWARFIAFNMRRPPFDDIKVRQALVLAFDFDWINHTLFQDSYRRTESIFPNSPLAHQGVAPVTEQQVLAPYRNSLPMDIVQPYQAPRTDGTGLTGLRVNLKQAVKLLQESGWDWRNGRMVNVKTKKPLAFEILINDPLDEKIALEYKRALDRIGVTVTMHTAETAQYIGRMSDFDFDATFSVWKNSLSPGTEQGVYWSSTAARTPGSFNYTGLANPAVDDLISRLTQTTDYADLTTTVHAMDRVIMHEWIGVPLFYTPVDMVAYRKGLEHPAVTPTFGPIPETWWRQKP